ncbi:YkgJ family cysteine cluster protein [Natronosalvus halobius]|uniref:YkgJ family cysteine cluster protein n=1 Tax=Natronosalvus halobius TaxID=2953746 RepID=UPI00209D5BA7|nr:YkgJ family cysteine cluster protein [Natronosalvus halobius]USZ70580.1 YkgJ family cysteine cluster protein [Natronosalvus halobius]
MRVYCQGCAGCCIDWRPLLEGDQRDAIEHERRGLGVASGEGGGEEPGTGGETATGTETETETETETRTNGTPIRRRNAIDDVYNLVPLTRDEVRAFLEAGFGDVLIPRLWEADAVDDSVSIDGYDVAAIAGRPAFFVGLRKPPKPVAPFGREDAAWLPTCTFLDPETLQCRIHGDDLYPGECAEYPAHNVALEQQTECERVEDAVGGERIRFDDSNDGEGTKRDEEGVTVDVEATDGLLLGPQAIGQKLFVHPDPNALNGRLERLVSGELTTEDRAAFVAVAAASAPGTLAISDHHYDQAYERVLEADSWAGAAIREWEQRASETPADPSQGAAVEVARGAPETPGWPD